MLLPTLIGCILFLSIDVSPLEFNKFLLSADKLSHCPQAAAGKNAN
jgi:hypothetical protein